MVPLGYLDAAGNRADTILPLTWFTIVVSVLVCVIIAALLWMGIRRRASTANIRSVPVDRGANGLRWISLGVAISAVPLLITLVWTMVALARDSARLLRSCSVACAAHCAASRCSDMRPHRSTS